MLNQFQITRYCYLPYALLLYFFSCLIIPAIGIAQTDGVALFNQEKYASAAKLFSQALGKKPDDPELNFKMGRSLLAGDNPGEAIRYLAKAARLAPKKAEFHFWLGVSYWALMDFENEKLSYQQALKIDPDHLSANLYLGHNYTDQNQLEQALVQYENVLKIDPDFPEALYNRAIVLEKLERTADTMAALKNYLDRYQKGVWALQVVEKLNQHGDFSYRDYWLGFRKIIMPATVFKPRSSRIYKSCKTRLNDVATALQINPFLTLHIVVYVQGDARLAERRAKAIKKYILESNQTVPSSQVKVSWLDVPETLLTGGKTYIIPESVKLFAETDKQTNGD